MDDKQGENKIDNTMGKGEPHRWQPGQSGNPNGRPKKDVCITSLVKELLGKDAGDGKTYAQLVAEAIVKLATTPDARGHVPTIKELLDRMEGKVTQPVATEGEIILKVKYDA